MTKKKIYYVAMRIHKNVIVGDGVREKIQGIHGFLPVFEDRNSALNFVEDESEILEMEPRFNDKKNNTV